MESQLLRLGKTGENLAADYLRRHGYRIIEKNFKKHYGELDLVCLDPTGKILVFVEVKTRIGREFGLPEEAVTPRKLAQVRHTAIFYKTLHPELPEALRIDVIGIELKVDETIKYFNHIENVTG